MLIDKINKNIILVNIVLEFQLADVQKTLSCDFIYANGCNKIQNIYLAIYLLQ